MAKAVVVHRDILLDPVGACFKYMIPTHALHGCPYLVLANLTRDGPREQQVYHTSDVRRAAIAFHGTEGNMEELLAKRRVKALARIAEGLPGQLRRRGDCNVNYGNCISRRDMLFVNRYQFNIMIAHVRTIMAENEPLCVL